MNRKQPKPCFSVIIALSIVFLPLSAWGWMREGRWSTAQYYCAGTPIKIGVDMSSRIGGGDASPIRSAYMNINGKTMSAVWIVGASMNSIETNNRDYTLVLNSSRGDILHSIGNKDKKCALKR